MFTRRASWSVLILSIVAVGWGHRVFAQRALLPSAVLPPPPVEETAKEQKVGHFLATWKPAVGQGSVSLHGQSGTSMSHLLTVESLSATEWAAWIRYLRTRDFHVTAWSQVATSDWIYASTQTAFPTVACPAGTKCE